MKLLRFIVACLFSIISTAIMSYISMATPIGPWIETTLVLCGMLIFNIFARSSIEEYIKDLGLTTAAGAIGGILATAFGFSFPTLKFIGPDIFNSWIQNPIYFCLTLSSLAFAAGSFGLLIAHIFENKLIVEDKLEFPIGQLIYKMICAKDQMVNAISLAFGFIGTNLYLLGQIFLRVIGRPIDIINIGRVAIATDLVPMLWAIGFVTGHVIALPLIVGLLARMLCLDPLYQIWPTVSNFLYTYIFSHFYFNYNPEINISDFTLAFCSGMVLFGAFSSFFVLPKIIKNLIKKINSYSTNVNKDQFKNYLNYFYKLPLLQVFVVFAFNIIFLNHFKFSFLSQFYLLFFTFICTYQLIVIAGKIGIAPLGRFATFVMVPGMFIFGYDPIQITFVAAFVEIAGGVACDVLFGRKMAQLAEIEKKSILFYQWLGLIVSSIVIGIVFWLLIYNFSIGDALPVSKAASRALLINVQSFDLTVLIIGFIFGYLLTFLKVNPMLVLGGILMPTNLSLVLIAGGLSTYLTEDKEKFYPFWSGVFAANSLWMILKTFF